MRALPDLALPIVQIDGMRMDLIKPRYETFDELYEYCYKVAGTVGLMTTPVMGVDPSYKVCCETSSSHLMWMLHHCLRMTSCALLQLGVAACACQGGFQR